MTPFGDGQDSVLTGNLQYQVLQTTFVIVVPAGFVTDFASTPRALWSVIPPTGRYQLAAVVHDFLYWDQGCTREQADAIFRVAMAEGNVKPYERDLMWHRRCAASGTKRTFPGQRSMSAFGVRADIKI
jgi:hypothetical protein